MKLSIIIPVYNAEETLRTCVESILAQSFRDYELLLTDDCSTDRSLSVCEELANQDRRIRIIRRRQNGGLSAARNAGLAKSHGEYITFVDADDFLGRDTLHEVMTVLKVHPDYDILEYPAIIHYGGPGQHRLALQAHAYTDMTQYWLGGKAYAHAYACNKIYRRKLFEHVSFPEGKVFEDAHTLPKLLRNASIVGTTNAGTYYYCYNKKGITATATEKELSDLLDAHLNYLREHEQEYDTASDEFALYYAHVLNIQLDIYEQTGKKPELPPYRVKPLTWKLRLVNLIGIHNLCRLHRYIHKAIPRRR